MNTTQRKHRSQMAEAEITTIEAGIRTMAERASLSLHTQDRMDQKGVTEHEIRQALRFGRLIEVHGMVRNDLRALIRLDRKKKPATCVVLSLRDGELKTAYKNSKDDNHATLDWDQYAWGSVNLLQRIGVN